MHVPEAFLKIYDQFPYSLEAEMPGLDDPCMDGPDGYLVNAFTLGLRPFIIAFYPGKPLRTVKRFPERPGILGPVLEFYPGPPVGQTFGR